MDTNNKLKLVAIAALLVAGVAAFMYLVYGLTIIWQGMAAGVTVGLLLILLFIVALLAIYLWIRIFLTRRALVRCQDRLEELERRLESDKTVKKPGKES